MVTPKETKQRKVTQLILIAIRRFSDSEQVPKFFNLDKKPCGMKQTKIIHEYKGVRNNILTLLELIGFEEDHFNVTHMNAKKLEGVGEHPWAT